MVPAEIHSVCFALESKISGLLCAKVFDPGHEVSQDKDPFS